MYTRSLIITLLLCFYGLISFGQFNSDLNPKSKSINPELIIQVGAFHNQSYALLMKEKLTAIIAKSVNIVTENGFFKVQITGFSGDEEMGEFFSTLAFLRIKDFWVLPVKKQEEIIQQTVVQFDTTIKSINENVALPVVTEKTPSVFHPSIVLQIDVFRNKSEAEKTQKIISTKLDLPVEIVKEWGYYKVFVTGFKTSDDANKCFAAIIQLGFSNISLIEDYKKSQ